MLTDVTEASPRLHTTTESQGKAGSTPSRRARPSASARPTARGRCEAIVEVCGTTPSRMSRTGSVPGTCCARAV